MPPSSARLFTSAYNPAVQFQLQPYTGNNVLAVSNGLSGLGSTSGTITLATPGQFSNVQILESGQGSGGTNWYATLNFADGTSTQISGFTDNDWTGTGNIAYSVNGLVSQGWTAWNGMGYSGQVSLFEHDITVPPAYAGKTLVSVSITDTGGTGRGLGVFALSGNTATQSYVTPVNVTANSTLDMQSSISVSMGTMSIGSNTLTVTGPAGGNFTLGAGSLLGSPTFSPTAGVTLTLGALAESGTSATITKAGSGALTLAGGNTYSGGTVFEHGQLNINNANALGSGCLTIGGGTLDNTSGAAVTVATNNTLAWNGDFTFAGSNPLDLGTGSISIPAGNSRTVTVSGGTLTVEGNISAGTANLYKSGAGTMVFANTANRVLQRLNVNGGAFVMSGGSLLLNSYFTLSTSGTSAAYVQTGGSVSTIPNFGAYVNNVSGAASTFTITGGQFLVNGSDGLHVATYPGSTGILNISGAGFLASPYTDYGLVGSGTSKGTINLGDGATFSGGSSIQNGGTSGLLATGQVLMHAGTSTFNFNGGTLKATGNQAAFLTGLTGAYVKDAGGIVDNGGYAITIGQALQHGGASPNDGGMLFQGSGTTTLTGGNTYNGGTHLTGGLLQLGGSGTLGAPTGGLTINSGMLNLGGTSPTVGTFSGAGGLIANNTTATASILTVGNGSSNVTTYNGTIVNNTNGGSGTVALAVAGSGMLTLGGGNSYSGGTTVSGGTLQLGSAAALGAGTGNLSVSGLLDLNGQTIGVGGLSARGARSIT